MSTSQRIKELVGSLHENPSLFEQNTVYLLECAAEVETMEFKLLKLEKIAKLADELREAVQQ